ncbi:hypothetical protein BW21_4396 [Burkholderia humptydooensis]|nr:MULTISPECIES: hypothetical protein [Burkholderia]AJY39504.1 hypothetical protein BW21_4396 [Burkholderia sp. 2002721687]
MGMGRHEYTVPAELRDHPALADRRGTERDPGGNGWKRPPEVG